jgi:flavin reductase (DIM6/NTAB) family NADH-FMN oxidoreductase RutF
MTKVVKMEGNLEGTAKPLPVDVEQFKLGMRCLAGCVTLITAGRGEHRRGMTATAVCSLSADPPALVVCVNRSASAHSVIRECRSFAVNLLSETQVHLAERFSGRDGCVGAMRFDVGEWVESKTGAPVLQTALASFDCHVMREIDVETHTVLFGRVVETVVHGGAHPLIYSQGTYRSIANAGL